MEIQYISSEENKIIKQINSLSMRKQRKKLKKFIVEGFRIINECFNYNPELIDYVIFSSNALESSEGRKLSKSLQQSHRVYEVSDKLFKKISDTENPQGILAIVNITEYKLEDIIGEDNSLFVILDRVQDPGNMGTIIRTAVAIKAKAIVLTKGSVDPYNSKTVRSTMGAVFSIPIIEVDDNSKWVNEFKENNIKLIGSSLDTDKNYLNLDYSGSLGIIIGNEANGIEPGLLEMVDEKVFIPILGNIESLNASVAAGVLLYKAVEEKLNS